MKKLFHILFYILPLMVWFYLIHNFYDNGQLYLSMDTKDFYFYTNHFLNHISRGVYPFWTPFSSWGRPDDLLALMIGVFNPFLYIILVLKALGLGFSTAYFIYLLMYFILGVAGAVSLSKQLFKNSLIVWFVYVSILFSNLDSNIFYSYLIILIFVPIVWFFNFLLLFIKNPQKSSLLGLTFCLMVIVTTYMPFHFIVIFSLFLILFSFIYFNSFLMILKRSFKFICLNKVFSIFCLIILLISLTPSVFWLQSSSQGGFIASWRGGDDPLVVVRDMIDVGNVLTMRTLINLFSNLQDYTRGNFYLPITFVLVFFMSVILPLTRRRILLVLAGIFLILFCLLNSTPLHGFFFKQVFFFKYFRNIHFLFWGFSFILILFIADLLDGLLTLRVDSRLKRFALCLFVFLIHGCALVFLSCSWSIIPASFVTCILSCILFLLYFSGKIKYRGNVFYALIAGVFLIQPLVVIWHVNQNSPREKFAYSIKPYTFNESKPRFSYVRPSYSEDHQMVYTRDFDDINDRSGFPLEIHQYQGTRYSINLLRNLSIKDRLQEYVRHKFILYDSKQDISSLISNDFPSGAVIERDSEQFKVLFFDLNQIKIQTNLPQPQLLVYNDNFFDGWKAYVNGRNVPIIRANESFKGVYLPAGLNTLEFSLYSPLYRGFFIFLILFFQFILILLICLSIKPKPNEYIS